MPHVPSLVARDIEPFLRRCASTFPAIALVGPRQSGKSSLARRVFPKHQLAVLESPDTARFAREDPRGFLARVARGGGAILDEIQRVPELFPYLLEVIDADRTSGKWILTGSESLLLSERLSQTLAGRVAILDLLPLSLTELARFRGRGPLPTRTLDQVLLEGGYPAIHATGADPSTWLSSYISTYLEKDVRGILEVGNLATFQRFMSLCAGRTGQLLSASSLAADAGVSQPTARRWLSVLEAMFVITLLPSWHGNVRKRLVKAPKLHMIDTGLACSLLGIANVEQLSVHPLRGAIFESWVVGEALKAQANVGERRQLFHWRDQNGAEVDLLIARGGVLHGVEAKSGVTFQSEWRRAMGRWSRALPASSTGSANVVFGGDEGTLPTEAVAWRTWPARLTSMFPPASGPGQPPPRPLPPSSEL